MAISIFMIGGEPNEKDCSTHAGVVAIAMMPKPMLPENAKEAVPGT